MSEEWKPPTAVELLSNPGGPIDPSRHLGNILNQLESVILTQGMILKNLCKLVAENNLMTPELNQAMVNAYRAEVSYAILKEGLISLAKAPTDG